MSKATSASTYFATLPAPQEQTFDSLAEAWFGVWVR
jgi:hypothetical protein